jgi:iron complex outermembrane receptor protein
VLYKTLLALALGAAWGLYSLAAQAEDANLTNSIPSDPTRAEAVLPSVLVIGTMETAAQRAATVERESVNAIVVIDAEQLVQFGEQSLGDALRRIPGVTFDGANRAREVRLRGLPDQYTQVLINGRRLLDGNSRRTVEVDRIPTGLVERIEVTRAPRATLDGQGAAGTVNIVLKNGTTLPTEVTVGGGYLEDNGSQGELGLVTGGRLGVLDYGLAFNAQRFRRSESKDRFDFDGTGQSTGAELQVNQRRFDQYTLAPTFTVHISEATRLQLEPIYLRTEENRDDIRTPLAADLITPGRVTVEDRERVRETYGIYAGFINDIDVNTRLQAGIDWQEGRVDTGRDEVRFNTNGTVNRTRQRNEAIDLSSLRPELALVLNRGSHESKLGVSYGRETHDEENAEVSNGVVQPPRPDRIFDITQRTASGYAEDQWQLTDDLQMTTGVRVEHTRTETVDFFGNRSQQRSTFVLPSLNLIHALQPDTDLRFGLSRSLRRPDLRSLSPAVESRSGSAADPDKQGNPNQQPESIWGLDAGLYHYFHANRGQLSLNAFARRFADKIENVIAVQDARFVARPENVGKAHAVGLEATARVPLDNLGLTRVTLWGNAVYTHSRVDEPDGGSRPFLDQPDWVANIGIDYFVPSLKTTFGVAVNQTTSIDQSQTLSDGGRLFSAIEARSRLDLSVRTQLTPRSTFSLSATNLLGRAEDRIDRISDADGSTASVSRTTEPTYRAVYARLNWMF